jgi:Tol biopolymer transport system component
MKQLIIAVLLMAAAASAQIRVTTIERLPLPAGQEWSNPIFSPDGAAIYFTTSSYDGIWKYSRTDNAVTEITRDPTSGYGFTVSSDGSQIAYRRSTYDARTHERTQEAIVVDGATLSARIAASGSDVSLPVFTHNAVVVSTGGVMHMPVMAKSASASTELLGIEDQKISLLKNGTKVHLDPLGSGSYCWPSLSADQQKIVAYDTRQGTFTCDLNGNILARLGRRDGAVWTRDGKWLVFMDDKDDGRRILTSDICMISSDGRTMLQLTSTPDVLEMNPACSPVENKIVCNGNGAIYVISYEEIQ